MDRQEILQPLRISFRHTLANLHAMILILQLGVTISDGQDPALSPPSTSGGGAAVFPPPPSFNVQSNWIFDGIDISKVEDIDNHPGSMELPNITDSSGKPLYTGLYSGPYFDLSRSPSNVTAQLGGSTLLPCVVKQVGKNSVSWIRRRDSHILSVDQTVFISDGRFRILRPEPGNEWNLHIKSLNKDDAGFYECQISTKVKMSHYVHLIVIVPSVDIDGSRDIHAQAGSSVTLRCAIQRSLHRPRDVSWYREKSPLQQDSNTVIYPISPSLNGGPNAYESIVKLHNVYPDQSGEFECRPQGLPAAQVNLHIVKGGTLAAMSDDRNKAQTLRMASTSVTLLAVIVKVFNF